MFWSEWEFRDFSAVSHIILLHHVPRLYRYAWMKRFERTPKEEQSPAYGEGGQSAECETCEKRRGCGCVICHFSLTPVEGAGIDVPYCSSHKTWHAVHYHLSPCQCTSPLLSSSVPLYLKTKRAHLTPFIMGSQCVPWTYYWLIQVNKIIFPSIGRQHCTSALQIQ